MRTVINDAVKPQERINGLGVDADRKLDYYLGKTKAGKLKRFIKKNIINTQKKDWN
jgi:hypothetical protein